MSQDKSTVRYLDLAVYYGFHILIFLVPLIFLTFTKEWFSIPKITLLRIGVVFLLFCWTLKQLLSKQMEFRHTSLNLLVLLFLSSAVISTLSSVHPATSFLGKSGRYEGLSTLIAYGILFFVAAQTFLDERRVSSLLDTGILAASLVAAYGLLQYLGYDFVSESQLFWEPNRSFSTLGNPVLLGGYLAMMLPIILSRYLKKDVSHRHPKLKNRNSPLAIFYGGAFLLSFASLITTFSRGAWLAGLAGLLFLAFVDRRQMASRRAAYLAFLLLLVFFLVGVTNYLRVSTSPEKNMSFQERLISLSRLKEGSAGSRLLIWRSSLEMFGERPLLGWGPDTFHFAFPAFSSLDFVRLEGAPKRADNAHNYFLQLAATQGIFGLFAFVALLISLFWTGFRFLSSQKRGKNHCRDDPRGRPNSRTGTSPVPTRNPNVRGRKRTHRHTSETPSHSPTCLLPLTTYYLYAGLLASIAGYVAYLLSGINSVEMGVMFWTFLGALSVDVAEERVILRKNLPPPFLALTILLITTAAGLFLSLMPFVADIRYASAEKLESSGFLDAAIEQGELALAANPYQDRYARYLGSLYAKAGDRSKALLLYLKAKQISRFEIDNSGRLAELYLQRALQGEEEYYKLAEKEFSHLLKVSPYSAIARSGLGFVYLATGRFKRAAQELNKAVDLDPQDAKAQLFLGVAYEKLEKKDKASCAYTQALSLDPNNKDALAALGRLGK